MPQRSETTWPNGYWSEGGEPVQVPLPAWEGNWMGESHHDLTGREIRPGDWVARAYVSGRAANLEIRQVREVRPIKKRSKFDEQYGAGLHRPADMLRVYLGDSKTPVDYPGRLLVIGWDPDTGKPRPLSDSD